MSGLRSIVWPRVILFGDSITQFSFQANGWGSEIADKLSRRCDVVNRGFSGYNSRWARIILPRIVGSTDATDGHVAAVTVFFGANDCSLQDKNPQQHVPLQEYAENLKDIMRQLAAVGVPAASVILITPPPLHEPTFEKECLLKGFPLSRQNSVAGQYAQVCVQTAGQCGAEVLDLWTLMQKDGQDFTSYLSDGLHLSAKGNTFVAEHLWPLLEKRVAHLPMILPYWGDVDMESPETSLLLDLPKER